MVKMPATWLFWVMTAEPYALAAMVSTTSSKAELGEADDRDRKIIG